MDLVEKRINNLSRHPWELARLKIVLKIFKKNLKYSNIDKFTVLDIGCGDTFIANAFLDRYPNATYHAVDKAFSDTQINSYTKIYFEKGKNILLYKDLDDVKKNSAGKINVVFLFDVIEHIENETVFLSHLNNNDLVNENAFFFITVPAFNSLFSSHDVFLNHYRRYNGPQLRATIEKVGLMKCKQGFFFFLLLIFRFVQVICEKKIKKNKNNIGVGAWSSKGIIDKIIINTLLLDYYFISLFNWAGIKIPGLSNFIICKRSV